MYIAHHALIPLIRASVRNLIEIHKPTPLHVRLILGVFIYTELKCRKRKENVAEIRVYLKARCNMGLSVKTINYYTYYYIVSGKGNLHTKSTHEIYNINICSIVC